MYLPLWQLLVLGYIIYWFYKRNNPTMGEKKERLEEYATELYRRLPEDKFPAFGKYSNELTNASVDLEMAVQQIRTIKDDFDLKKVQDDISQAFHVYSEVREKANEHEESK